MVVSGEGLGYRIVSVAVGSGADVRDDFGAWEVEGYSQRGVRGCGTHG